MIAASCIGQYLSERLYSRSQAAEEKEYKNLTEVNNDNKGVIME